ncbi:hypothetical protein P153DRAFT_315118 [Dothidotthia symphoricarpi CBS 119687]|uniref:Uncharacterized protein n=1 Tax=Dothidotthia symphoricarpi CBS 119687 TaxID=1392245 RepID=A0A6A6AD58_9PLEO|nr:uncharacterized protein P153DRAFT_315118 [Dothidotthia symphoricarpi CBS 119687]KAF2129832.1 hypothetical protein P153DRAFT_315118 [Dothidotthia symphoricarpi CBS 119687]
MSLRYRAEYGRGGSPYGLQSVRHLSKGSWRALWTLFASTSLLSSRHALVEKNIHYPLQLNFNHLVATGLISWLFLQPDNTLDIHPKPKKPMTRKTALVAFAMSLMSISAICTQQAILHFQNLPTLVMITTIAFVAESLVLSISGIASQTQVEFIRVGLLVSACAGLLFVEYRLNVPGLVASIPAMLLAGAARALWRIASRYCPEEVADCRTQTRRLVLMGALVNIIWVIVFWSGDPIFAFDLTSVPLLTFNAITSALALILGKSMLFPIDDEDNYTASEAGNVPVFQNVDIWTLLALTGITGCYATLSQRRSYTNVYQFGCFFFAMLCISGKASTGLLPGQPQYTSATRSTHQLTDLSVERLSDDSGISPLFEEIDETDKYTSLPSWWNLKLRRFLLSVGVILVWTVYGVSNFTERSNPSDLTLLDEKYVPTMDIEIVLSMYKEPLDEVNELIHNLKSMPDLSDAHVTIYIKDTEADSALIKQHTKADDIILLPNVGREGETYLNHILNRWDTLARQTIFMQADVHNPREFYTHVRNYYSRDQTGFLNLGWSGAVCDCEHCGDRFAWEEKTGLFPTVQSQINNSTSCENVLLSYKGQFVVSAARVRGINKDIYRKLHQAISDENSWAHQPEYLEGRPDSMSAPRFGYTLERIWNLLFQCSNMELAWKCPSLISGWRIGGDISDCQCFDT